MADKYRERFEDGAVIVSIGPMVKDLAIGDVVIRPDPPRYEIIDDNTNEELWLCAEEDILAKVLCDTTGFPVVDAKVVNDTQE